MKRRQEFDDEEMLDEKHPRRSPLIGSPVRNENIGPNENVVADVNPNIYADYLKLDESYADLECKYSEAMSRLAAYEQTEYEDEEAVNNATEAINETKKKADKVEAEIANVAKKIETVESLNKNLNDTVAALQKANEKIQKDAEEEATSLQNQINDLQHHLETERLSAAQEKESQRLECLKRIEEQRNFLQNKIDNVQQQLEKERENHMVECKSKTDTVAELQKINETLKKDAEEQCNFLQNQINDVQHELEKERENKKIEDELKTETVVQLQKAKEQCTSLQNKIDNLERQLERNKNLVDQDKEEQRLENERKIEEFQRKIDDLQHHLESATQERESERAEYEMKTDTVAELQKINEKIKLDAEQQITFLQNQINDLQHKLKEEKSSAAQEKENQRLENERKIEEQRNLLQIKVEQLQHQLEEERTAAAKERENNVKEYQDMEASFENAVSTNAKTITDKERLEKELSDLQKTLNDTMIALEASVNDRAKELFKKWKLAFNYKKKNLEDGVRSESLNIAEESDLKSSQIFKVYEPRWLLLKAICYGLYKAYGNKVAKFLQEYTSLLFNSVEVMLPEEKLNKEKWDECITILFWFWKPENDHQKELCIAALKKKMEQRRNRARDAAFKECTLTRCIAFTSNGIKFYYSLRKFDAWKPVAKKENKKALKYKSTLHSSFCIPIRYSSLEYILILQKCSDNGKKIFKMLPATGYTECIFDEKNL